MQLRKVTIGPDSELTHEIFCVALPSASNFDVLVMRFTGTYGIGASGNGDAEFMTAMTRAAISFTHPFGLIFDLTRLRYERGDMMGQVLSSGAGRWVNEEMPMAIVVSDLSESAIRSLLTDDLLIKDLGLVHHSLESAINDIDQRNRYGKTTSTT